MIGNISEWMARSTGVGAENSAAAELGEDERLGFSREYDPLPVTTSASRVMDESAEDKKLQLFLDRLPTAELYPVGNTSWADVNAAIKQRIGKAVTPKGSPEGVLGGLQATATRAESAR
ncbi:hypothetical protein GCM10027073_50400 [Streptomyces chlorus]